MAHDVRFEVPVRNLQREDVTFQVFQDGEKFGELRISKGSLVWFPRNHSNGFKIGWKKFDSLVSGSTRIEKKR
jgi:hypothetical protein